MRTTLQMYALRDEKIALERVRVVIGNAWASMLLLPFPLCACAIDDREDVE